MGMTKELPNFSNFREIARLADMLKHDVTNYDFSEYADMDLTDTEKLFIITYKKIPLKKMISTDSDNFNFVDYLVSTAELYMPFYHLDGDYNVLLDNMRQTITRFLK